ncbi:coxsackievirus and adenovirus receptor-like isoform X3 [Solea senegalensis]|uniref:Coxsackievirus and adenovirus receptor-like isoform X3 n=1 Tax=Solea senegalensis TaxID=28829 RepID=A0AAV6Q8U1_SOLSE|nr:uncharacterized protein LOC122771376 isoform X1 [Solea senegalensis]KAG7486011.1 coxsackievirus and adenovirus receptor-like isoform X3 [Solea senegalensis]
MISWILLLVLLSPCVRAGVFVVNVSQVYYQAEEKDNVTLEWTFTTKPNSAPRVLYVVCSLRSEHKVLYHLHEGVEVSDTQDEQFSGRVRCERGVLREGRIRLRMSTLRTNDSGMYLCRVWTDYGRGSEGCRLNVTAVDESEPQRPTETPPPRSRRNIGLYIALGFVVTGAAAVTSDLLVLCSVLRSNFSPGFIKSAKKDEDINVNQ